MNVAETAIAFDRVSSDTLKFTNSPVAGRLQPESRMAGFKDFREIAAWRYSREVRQLAYALLARPAVAQDFKFRDQLLDSSRSAPRNIAEGFARYKHKEFARFVRVAKGSMGEVLNHFIDAVDSGYLAPAELPSHEHACKKALKAINGLIRYLESTPDIPPPKRPPKRPTPPRQEH